MTVARGRKATGGEKTGHAKTSKNSTSSQLAPVEDRLLCADPPGDLAPAAAEAWRVCITEMGATRALREPDLIILRSYVSAIHIHEEAWANIQAHGTMLKIPLIVNGQIVVDDNGAPLFRYEPNPAVRVRDQQANQIRYYSDLLGLNPSSRIRLKLNEVAGASMVAGVRNNLVDSIVANATR